MGAWGTGSFENDSAADWIADLDAALPVTLGLTLSPVADVETDLYVDELEASEAIAAAEVVAAMGGHPGRALDDRPEVREWALNHADWLSAGLVRQAATAVERVRSASELRELWAETDSFTVWLEALEDLLRRLRPA